MDTFRGALRLTANTYGEPIGGTADDCGRITGQSGYNYNAVPLANVLIQGGVIAGSRDSDSPSPQITNDGVVCNWQHASFNPNIYTPGGDPAYFSNVILSNLKIMDVPAPPSGVSALAGVRAETAFHSATEGLHGAVIVNNVSFANIATGSQNLVKTPATGSPPDPAVDFKLATGDAGTAWAP